MVSLLLTARSTFAALALYGVECSIALVATSQWRRPFARSAVLQLVALVATRAMLISTFGGHPGGYAGTVLALVAGAALGLGRRRAGAWAGRLVGKAGDVRVLVLLGVLLALPSFLSPVARYWDMSGWMDSLAYDRFAHGIATGDAPAGSSDFMPLYQYGPALIYFVFGHYYFLQQVVNVVLGLGGIVLLALAAWNLFPSPAALGMVFVWAGLNPAYTYAVYFTQIESWYLPAVSLALFLWSCYWREPRLVHLVLLALAGGVLVNLRQQGLLLAVVLCAAPAAVPRLTRGARLGQIAIAQGILVLSFLPWTVRNVVVEDRLSPFALRNVAYLAVLNDDRVAFYGIRYERFGQVLTEYLTRYPDPAEREAVMLRDARRRLLRDPVWLAKATFWRAVGFYGLLPPGVMASDGPRATRPDEWPVWGRAVAFRLALIGVSILGLACRPGRTTSFLVALVLANLAIVLVSPTGGDPRICSPSLSLHILLGAAVFSSREADGLAFGVRHLVEGRGRFLTGAALAGVVAAVVCRHTLGRPNAFRLLREPTVIWQDVVFVDRSRPLAAQRIARRESAVGETVRVTFIASNEMYPPKFMGEVPGIPRFATDYRSDTFYFGHRPGERSIGVSYTRAAVERGVREGDAVEAEGVVLAEGVGDQAPLWLKAEKVRHLRRRAP